MDVETVIKNAIYDARNAGRTVDDAAHDAAQQVTAHYRKKLSAYEPYKNFVDDLDRCVHGRHSIDDCFSCPGGASLGNELLRQEAADELAIGNSLYGGVYVLRKRGERPNAVSPLVHRRVDRETGEVADEELG